MAFVKPNQQKEINLLAFKVLTWLKTQKADQIFTKTEILKALDVDKVERTLGAQALQVLESKKLVCKRGAKWQFIKFVPLQIEGVIHTHPRGFGFVAIPHSIWPEVFIPKSRVGKAADGDTVLVDVDYTKGLDKGPEGVVKKVLSRSRETVIGTIFEVLPNGHALARVSVLKSKVLVRKEKKKQKNLAVGDRVRIAVKKWGEPGTDPEGVLKEKLGSIYEPKDDIQLAILEHEIREEFSPGVHREVESFPTRVTPKDCEGRRDYRNSLTLTIDPKTAKDFDDALTLCVHKNGHRTLVVHIADVSHYVAKGTKIDEEAFLRGNSTYFPGKCVPMLPPALADNLCSLKPRVNRLTVSVEMEFDEEANLLRSEVYKGIIRSQKRYTYEQAQAILEHKRKDPHAETIRKMADLSKQLRLLRKERGAVELSIKEVVINVDENGVPIEPVTVEYDESHKLVEEFMVKANEVIATRLDEKGIPSLYRIHEQPSDDNVKEFMGVLRNLGVKTSARIDGHFLSRTFEDFADHPCGPFLVGAYIRSMQMAIYDPEPKGHFGLQLEYYTHFTSPIRRYADLVVHRALFDDVYEEEELALVAKHCSERERVSSKAESSVIILKKLRLLQKYFVEDPTNVYRVVVTKVLPFGIVVSHDEVGVDGMIHVTDFHDDYYEYDEKAMKLVGRHTKRTLAIGTELEAYITSVNLIHLEVKWALRQEEPKRHKKGKGKNKRFKAKGKAGKGQKRNKKRS
jgi:ribonuclease R